MRREIWIAGVLSLGCGPQVTLDTAGDDDDTGTSGTAGDGRDGGVADGRDDGIDDTAGTLPDFGGSADTTDGPPVDPPSCWQVDDMFEVPADVDITVTDQDGDGADELWLVYNVDTPGPGPGDSTLYRVDASGVPGPEIPLDGFLVAIGDIDGDGLQDLVLVDFSMGFPPVFAWAPGGPGGTFTFPPLPMTLGLGGGLSGFFDIDGDAIADVFDQQDDGSIDLLLGDGSGGFAAASNLPLGIDAPGYVSPVQLGPGRGMLQTYPGFGGGGGGGGGPDCLQSDYRLLDGAGGNLQLVAAGSPTGGVSAPGPMMRSHAYPTGITVTWAQGCSDAGEILPQLWQLMYTRGTGFLGELTVVSDMQWVAIANLDGDELLDMVFAAPGAETIAWSPGVDELSFGKPQPSTIPILEVRDNNVRAVDMNGDGREEVLRGWVLAEGDPAQLYYDRVSLLPCE